MCKNVLKTDTNNLLNIPPIFTYALMFNFRLHCLSYFLWEPPLQRLYCKVFPIVSYIRMEAFQITYLCNDLPANLKVRRQIVYFPIAFVGPNRNHRKALVLDFHSIFEYYSIDNVSRDQF